MAAKKEEPECLTPECGKPAAWKGLCRSCYGCAKTLIDKGDTSWEELGQLGLAEVPMKIFYKAFKERKKNAQVNQENPEEAKQPVDSTEFLKNYKSHPQTEN